MEPFSIQTTITLSDWKAYTHAWAFRTRATRSPTARLLLFSGSLLATLMVIAMLRSAHAQVQFASLIGGVVIGIGVLSARLAWQRRTSLPDPEGSILGPCHFEFDADGFRVRRPGIEGFVHWSRVRELDSTAEHAFLWLDRISGHLVPLRDLPQGMSKDEVIRRLRAVIAPTSQPNPLQPQSSTSSESAHSETTPVIPTSAGSKASAWGAILGRLWTLRMPRGDMPAPSDSLIGIAAVASLALWVALGWFRVGSGAKFSPYGTSGIAWAVLEVLSLAWALSRLARPRQQYRTALFLIVALLPLLIGVHPALAAVMPQRLPFLSAIVVEIYALLYVARGLRSMTGRHQVTAVVAALGIVVAFTVLRWELGLSSTVWYNPSPREAVDFRTTWEQGESLLFAQPGRVDAMLARVKPSDSANSTVPDVYFVGFAGVAEQRVFAQEIKLAASRVDERYGSAPRTLLLVNDRRDLETYPLASVSGLRRTLSGIAAKMDLDRDVLFLSISSHGSKDPSISVSNGELPLQELTGEALAGALRDSHIKWRVIVISACHAGAFIDSLRDDHTVVLTAAAADRTSFGCSDDRDLTYFGEAFYRDAFPHAASLREAFDRAKADIAAREVREHITPSDPRAFFGAAAATKLAELEKLHQGTTMQASSH